MYNIFQIFENTFNKKIPLSGISGIYPEWHSTPYIVQLFLVY